MREPLFKIMWRIRKMSIEDRCAYLIACIKTEHPDSSRRRELQRLLVQSRTDQINIEIIREKRSAEKA
jgi:hypothetical protein